MKFYDITVPLSESIPIWPNSVGFKREISLSIKEGEKANASWIKMDLHCGTHIDAPLHFVKNGKSVDEISLIKLNGECLVIDIPEQLNSIDSEFFEAANLNSSQRILLKTSNSKLWSEKKFSDSYQAISADGANWLVENNIKLIGIDYLSIQKFYDGPQTHKILLGNEIIILEGINLLHVPSGKYDLGCYPLLIPGAEAAPARVILIKHE